MKTMNGMNDYFEQKGHQLGKLVDEKQAAYGDSISKASKLMKIYLEDYKTDSGYLIPEELLDHILLQVRIIDKQNRIFTSPKADKMDESPYDDISGYGLLGGRMQNECSSEIQTTDKTYLNTVFNKPPYADLDD